MKKLALGALILMTLQCHKAKAEEYAFACKWDSGDIVFAVHIVPGQKELTRTYDLDPGTVKIRLTDFSSKKFVTDLEFYEKGKTYSKTARCFMGRENENN